MKTEHTTENDEAVASFHDDPMQVVRVIAGLAAQHESMSEAERRGEPSPVRPDSPIVLAAKRICVLRGYAENGNELPGFMERAARDALPGPLPEVDEYALNDAAWEFIDNAPRDSIIPLLWNNLKQALRPAVVRYLERAKRAESIPLAPGNYQLMYNTMLNRAKDAGFQSISDAIRAAAEAKEKS